MRYSMKIARPYAKAVFNIAKKDGSYDEWKFFLFFFTKVIEKDEVKNFLKNPLISSLIKIKFLQSIYKDIFKNDLLDNFISFLIYTKKFLLISFIYLFFMKSLSSLFGSVQLKIDTACSIFKNSVLDKNIVIFLNSAFGEKFFIIERKIDKKLIGGIVVNDISHNNVIDMSFYGNLICLKKKLLIL